MTRETDLRNAALRALVCLDLTNLDEGCTAADIDALCRRAQTPEGSVAAVCIWPRFVAQAKAALAHTGIRVATVVDFPRGDGGGAAAAAEARAALADGADEIDMVVPWRALKAGDEAAVPAAVAAVKAACGDALLKVIIEACLLTDAEKELACVIAKEEGADFVKTSTGFSTGGATVEDIGLMRRVVGPDLGVKASGGIRNTETAFAMIEAGATRIGASASLAIIGANAPKAPAGY